MTAAIITLCVALVVCVIVLLIALYHQLLLINEVNKRLIILVENSVENERATADRLTMEIEDKENIIREQLQSGSAPKEDAQTLEDEYQDFNPHDALDALD